MVRSWVQHAKFVVKEGDVELTLICIAAARQIQGKDTAKREFILCKNLAWYCVILLYLFYNSSDLSLSDVAPNWQWVSVKVYSKELKKHIDPKVVSQVLLHGGQRSQPNPRPVSCTGMLGCWSCWYHHSFDTASSSSKKKLCPSMLPGVCALTWTGSCSC
jgi:hypothetical protein